MVGLTARRHTIDITAHQKDDRAVLQQRVRGEPNAKARDRARCVLLAIDRLTAPQIAQRVGRSRRFVQRWCYAYRDHGLDGLQIKPRSGRPAKLTSAQQQAFKQRLLDGPKDQDGVCALRGIDAQRILEAEFGVAYSLNGVYDLMHRLGLSCLKPRPRHRKADPQTQQRWLDDAPLLSSVCATSIPISVSKCGSRTKHASGSKAD